MRVGWRWVGLGSCGVGAPRVRNWRQMSTTLQSEQSRMKTLRGGGEFRGEDTTLSGRQRETAGGVVYGSPPRELRQFRRRHLPQAGPRAVDAAGVGLPTQAQQRRAGASEAECDASRFGGNHEPALAGAEEDGAALAVVDGDRRGLVQHVKLAVLAEGKQRQGFVGTSTLPPVGRAFWLMLHSEPRGLRSPGEERQASIYNT